MFMGLWSSVLLIIVGIQLSQVKDDGIDTGGDNPDNWSEREEKAYELAGVILGFISSEAHAYYYYKNQPYLEAPNNIVENPNQDNKNGAELAEDVENVTAGVS